MSHTKRIPNKSVGKAMMRDVLKRDYVVIYKNAQIDNTHPHTSYI